MSRRAKVVSLALRGRALIADLRANGVDPQDAVAMQMDIEATAQRIPRPLHLDMAILGIPGSTPHDSYIIPLEYVELEAAISDMQLRHVPAPLVMFTERERIPYARKGA